MKSLSIQITFLICSVAIFSPLVSSCQTPFAIGLEQDFLPYATGGYYGAAWVGKSHVRARLLLAHVNKPSFIVPNGFTNNVVTAYALVGDYFIKSGFSGWYLSGGLVIWNSSIQSTLQQNTTSYQNTLMNGTLGYNWKFHKNFYLSPWAGLHLRLGGADRVTVDGSSFTTPLFTPEASLKLGWYFSNGSPKK
jgi:hypothetical protein